MIDIHSHILYGVDDGPKSVEEALDMLERAVEEGITEIISTSHSFHPQYNVLSSVVTQQVASLQQRVNELHIPLQIHCGQEVRLVENIISLLENGEILTLANSW